MATENSYQQLVHTAFYEQCPKAVFAAIAASFIINHQARGDLSGELLREWYTLHMQGIIPQAPPKSLWNDILGPDERTLIQPGICPKCGNAYRDELTCFCHTCGESTLSKGSDEMPL